MPNTETAGLWRPLIIFLVCVVALLCLWRLGFRLNTTRSVPLGLYRIASGPIMHGDLAAYCLTDPELIVLAQERQYLASGVCPSGLRTLLKQAAGLPGDDIIINNGLIFVNGLEQPNSAAKAFDSKGRPTSESRLKPGCIPAGQALLLAYHANSFDSRYFGLVPLAELQRVEPVLTIKD